MAFALLFAIMMMLLLALVCLPKRLHRYEYVFVWLAFVTVFTTLVDTFSSVNSDRFEITEHQLLYAAERLWELVTVPVVLLLFLNAAHMLRSWWSRGAAALVCLAVLFGLEQLVVAFRLIKYGRWNPWWSLIAWAGLIAVAVLFQQGMRRLLRREDRVS